MTDAREIPIRQLSAKGQLKPHGATSQPVDPQRVDLEEAQRTYPHERPHSDDDVIAHNAAEHARADLLGDT